MNSPFEPAPPGKPTPPPAGPAPERGSAASQDNAETPDRRPLYAQVKDLILRGMVRGDWRPGTLLPSEQQLARQFAVSQGTVRKALDEMVAQNLLVRRQGRGTFVASHTPDRALFHFFHLVAEDGSRTLPESRILGAQSGPATPAETAALRIGPDTVHRIRRIRLMAGKPAIHEIITVPASLFPDLLGRPDGLPNSLYSLYEDNYGVTIARADELLSAVAADKDDAEILDVPVGAPLLQIDRTAVGLDGRRAEWRVSRCDTRHHRYASKLE